MSFFGQWRVHDHNNSDISIAIVSSFETGPKKILIEHNYVRNCNVMTSFITYNTPSSPF